MPDATSSSSSATKRIAAIDLGTNSFHAVIVDIFPDGSFVTVDALKEMICLGRDGVGRILSHAEIELGIDTLKKIKTLCVHQNVESILAYATSAIREAENGGVFIQRAIDEVQIKIHAIPGIMEAELVAYAVQHGMQLGNTPHLIMDIGGGSTEFIIADNKTIFFKGSKKLGVSRMNADFINHDPVPISEIKILSTYYENHLGDIKKEFENHPTDVLIGSSGTMQSIAAMIASMKNLSTSVTLNEFEYSAEDFNRFYDTFIKLNRKKRLEVAGLDNKRVDFIIPGLVLVKKVIGMFGIKRIKTSVQAMREGIILLYIRQEMKNLQYLAEFPDTRRRSVFELLRKCRWHELHSSHVCDLSLKLFDQTRHLHKMGESGRDLLEYSALLHDIGYHISHRKHHKHSLYIILNADLKSNTSKLIGLLNEKHDDFGLGHALAADFYILVGDEKKTIAALNKTTETMPYNEMAWQRRVQMLFAAGLYDDAIEAGHEADEFVPDDVYIFFFTGLSYSMTERKDDALVWLKKAADVPATRDLRSDIHGTIGDTYSALDNWPEAEKAYDKALEFNSENDVALNNYAYYLSVRELRLDDALNMAKRAIEMRPENPAFLDTLGWIYFKLENYEKAEEYIQASIDTGEASATVLEHMGDVYEKLGDMDEAKIWWRKSFEKDATRDNLRDKLNVD